jgi:hypothetical protein
MAGSSLKNQLYQKQFHGVNINRQKTGKSLLKWSGLGWILSRTASIGYSHAVQTRLQPRLVYHGRLQPEKPIVSKSISCCKYQPP